MAFSGLIAGLGNPGAEYRNTRHNFGFMAIERLLRESAETKGRLPAKLSGNRDNFELWKADFGEGDTASAEWLLLKPLTFMNGSGEAVLAVSSYYRINSWRILIVHDELDLPPGRMKMKKGGGSAGHKGIQSIEHRLGTADFFRLRLGIGKPEQGRALSHVLEPFAAAELETVEKCLSAALHSMLLFIRTGAAAAQQFCNSFSL
ncbi:MAG: aminoacyl-tRNA hydrolase [Desulfovibrio sp.]|jgi:PTH1 family peptidyl-tRNA hydrolase|nr:aminoacyl-tRNA hydrolase [Desulfovibrio sp.]